MSEYDKDSLEWKKGRYINPCHSLTFISDDVPYYILEDENEKKLASIYFYIENEVIRKLFFNKTIEFFL